MGVLVARRRQGWELDEHDVEGAGDIHQRRRHVCRGLALVAADIDAAFMGSHKPSRECEECRVRIAQRLLARTSLTRSDATASQARRQRCQHMVQSGLHIRDTQRRPTITKAVWRSYAREDRRGPLVVNGPSELGLFDRAPPEANRLAAFPQRCLPFQPPQAVVVEIAAEEAVGGV